ncbi:hypothetical protein N7495_004640 [Penicillium taxi]|uniref:uncharacterized protein n=1 Tax=Penicillium taxi TaxID=168475 RepID=UPI0025458C8D|nr:uncharacterized protein N7495_004640 [Penicillium taxi]KAJ5899896.1 hypothetical protein N7495_004640 [Penicillium taxi]
MGYIHDQDLPKRLPDMNLVSAPTKTTLPSSGVVNGEETTGSFQHINDPFMTTPSKTEALVDSIPTDSSFAWGSEDTSFPAASIFNFIEISKEEAGIYHGLSPTFHSPVSNIDEAWPSTQHFSNYWPVFEPVTPLAKETTHGPFYSQSNTQFFNRPMLSPASTNTDLDQDYPIQIQVVSPTCQPHSQVSYPFYPGNTYTRPEMLPYQEQVVHADQTGPPKPASYCDKRNSFLIECKRRGLSYKEIKRLGGFKEAESTLRGRFRTLTKSKEQRVRKPKWENCDIKLLCEAVTLCKDKTSSPHSPLPDSTGHQPPKVSWKKVAQYIWAHGGSYQFGNATCKKKWCEIYDIST